MKTTYLALALFAALSAPAWSQNQTWFHDVDSDQVKTYQEAPDSNPQDRELKSYEDEKRVDENKSELKSYERERGPKENDTDFSNRKPQYKSRDLTDD